MNQAPKSSTTSTTDAGVRSPDKYKPAHSGVTVEIVTDYAAILDRVATALPDGYEPTQLFADLLLKRVFALKSEQLVAVVQFVSKHELNLMLVAGKGCSAELLTAVAKLTERRTITCRPKSAAHARLYKRLGFVGTGKELTWTL